MNLKRVLNKEVISADLKGETKEEIIDSLVALLFNAGKVKDAAKVKQCILERESKMTTGMEAGIAIPHGKTDAVDELVGCIGIKKGGVDFKALDGKPSNIFVMTVSPLNKTGPHVQFLAEISRLLREESQRARLLEAESSEEIFSIFCG
ncbi:MAG: PTS sugar transporter subunit IIA [Spirochaetales bacterium]|nr:PTS sugar transporter subunit IIA [Spirochaetales bacterium]